MAAVDMIHFKLAHNGETRRFVLPHLPYLEKALPKMLERVQVRVHSIVEANEFKLMWKSGLPDGDCPLESSDDLSAALDYAIAMAAPTMPPCVDLEVIVAAAALENELQTEEVDTAADLPECDSDDDDTDSFRTIQTPLHTPDSASERPVTPQRPSKPVYGVGLPVRLVKTDNDSLSTEQSTDVLQSVKKSPAPQLPVKREQATLRPCKLRPNHPQQSKTGIPEYLLQKRSDSLQFSSSSQSTIGVLSPLVPLGDENKRLKRELKKAKKQLEEYKRKTMEMRLAEVERRLMELEKKEEDYERRDTEKIGDIQNRMDDMDERIEVLEDHY